MYVTNSGMCGYTNAICTVLRQCVSRGSQQPVRIISPDKRAIGHVQDVLYAAGVVDLVACDATFIDPFTNELTTGLDIRGKNGQWPTKDFNTTVWLWMADFRKGTTSKRSALSPR